MNHDHHDLELQTPVKDEVKTDLDAHPVPAVVEGIVILKDVDIDFPDGGLRAWLVVFGVSCS